jgi:hypothetical protein
VGVDFGVESWDVCSLSMKYQVFTCMGMAPASSLHVVLFCFSICNAVVFGEVCRKICA